jgi:catalase
VLNHNRDGQHRQTITKSHVNYWPNRFESITPATHSEGAYVEYRQKVSGLKQRTRGPKFQEHYSQAQLFYNSLSQYEKSHVLHAISFELSHCDDPLVYKNAIPRLNEIDHELAKAVATKIGGDIPLKPSKANHGKTAPGLSQMDLRPDEPTIKSRRIAILVTDGVDGVAVQSFRAAIKAGEALSFVIGPRRGQIKTSSGVATLQADHSYEGQRSTLFDAIFIPPGAASVGRLAQDGRVIHWVREAFGHCKAIGAVGEG